MNEPTFVAASHKTGLDTMSMTRRSIKVGIRRRGGQPRVKARARVTMMHQEYPKVAQPKLGVLRPQFYLCRTGPASEPAERNTKITTSRAYFFCIEQYYFFRYSNQSSFHMYIYILNNSPYGKKKNRQVI